MGKLKTCFLATRPQFLPGIMIPVALGAGAAYHATGVFKPGLFIVSLIAAIFYHAGMNVINDYFDYYNGTDNINKGALTPFTGGSRFIQNGLLTPKATLALGLGLLAFGSLAGIYLAWQASWALLAIGAVGLFSGFFYSAPPIFLAGRGLGEITVGINFGLLTVMGSYLVQTGTFSMEAVLASLPVSFLIAALLYINEFPDYEADRASGKKTLVVRLGPERGRYGIIILVIGAYGSIIAGVAAELLHPYSLIALIPIVFIIPGIRGLIKNYRGGAPLIPSIKSVILAHALTGVLLTLSFFL